MEAVRPNRKPLVPTIVAFALLVGTLDISSALLYYYINTGKNPLRVFYFIASALFGKGAYDGGLPMILMGALIHYLIAATFTVLFFLLYPRLPFLSRSIALTAIIYGLFIWCVMNLVMLPLLHIHGSPKTKDLLINMAILMIAIGLPLSYGARRYYRRV